MVLGAGGAAIQTRAAYVHVSGGGYGTWLQAYKQKAYGLRGCISMAPSQIEENPGELEIFNYFATRGQTADSVYTHMNAPTQQWAPAKQPTPLACTPKTLTDASRCGGVVFTRSKEHDHGTWRLCQSVALIAPV